MYAVNRNTNSKIQEQVIIPIYKVRKRTLLSKEIHSRWRQKWPSGQEVPHALCCQMPVLSCELQLKDQQSTWQLV